MELYTFLMEFRGGTYISQVYAECLFEAVKLWGEKLDTNDIQHLGNKGKIELLTELKDIDPIGIRTVKNVWFFCLSIRKGYIAVNVIKTSKTEKLKS
jgi:hypothetical protein